jgi:putative salt-induced outer membrane protein
MTRAAVTLCLLLLAAPATAQETCPCPPPPPPPPLWTGSIGFSYLATSGNSDSETIGLTVGFAREPTPWGLEIQALANRAESDGEKTAERIFASLRGKRALGERYQLFAGVSYESDEFAGFDSRTVLESGVLWRALAGPVHKLDFDLGLAWTDEEPVLGAGFDYFGGIAGVTYVWKINALATFRERLAYYPNFDESADWRLRSETSLEAALASAWALRVGYLFFRDNVPAPGFEKDDSTTSVSLVWKR